MLLLTVFLTFRVQGNSSPFRFLGVIHIVRTHKGGWEGLIQMRTIAYKGERAGEEGGSRLRTHAKNKFFGPQKLKTYVLFKRSY